MTALYRIRPLVWVTYAHNENEHIACAMEKTYIVYPYTLFITGHGYFPCTSIEDGKAQAEAHHIEMMKMGLERME